MTYDPIDTNENDNNADGKLTIDDLTATTVAGLDTSSGTGNEQIFTDGEGGLVAPGYVSELPVAYSNLVAWYPFDSARYTGSNADDVTGIIGGSGDDTAFDGTVNGATYQSSGGVTDINAGTNSGAYDFDGTNDALDVQFSSNESQPITIAAVAECTVSSGRNGLSDGVANNFNLEWRFDTDNYDAFAGAGLSGGSPDQDPHIITILYDGANSVIRVDGTQIVSGDVGTNQLDGITLGSRLGSQAHFEGQIGEWFIYPQDKSAKFSDIEQYLSLKWGISI